MSELEEGMRRRKEDGAIYKDSRALSQTDRGKRAAAIGQMGRWLAMASRGLLLLLRRPSARPSETRPEATPSALRGIRALYGLTTHPYARTRLRAPRADLDSRPRPLALILHHSAPAPSLSLTKH